MPTEPRRRLIFIAHAMRELFGDEKLISLLKVEKLDSMLGIPMLMDELPILLISPWGGRQAKFPFERAAKCFLRLIAD